MSDVKQEKVYFENMSAAFAKKAKKVATVMHRDIKNPPVSGIWERIERDVIKRSGLVDHVSFSNHNLLGFLFGISLISQMAFNILGSFKLGDSCIGSFGCVSRSL